ncbi:CAP domain-containing protein [Halorientalis regularis]|uniref:Cysteine-rich secretory protein family protein n=1 Tax=Halorientalis regularis TaxID=660518 RepID=A0A1G7FQN2_9EURY|nr:CAP domain-containing protein [Halorientalis regularis]SDE78142.1 Cysteine-rich secretory protein family protein [Halorientalis regularis]
MVNKAALSVLGVIVLVSMGVGVLIGMQIGGGGAGTTGMSTPTPGEGTAQGPGDGESNPRAQTTIPGGEIETVQPPEEEQTIPARRFERREINTEIKRLINQRRTNRDLSDLITDGQVTDKLDTMARNHSVAMADEGRVSHAIDGIFSKERYKRAGLYSSCQFNSNPGTYVVNADGNQLEVIGHVVAGRTHDGEFLATEKEVARAIVDAWFSGITRNRLLYENANQIGIGVEVTQSGDVYVTGNLC